MKQSGKKIKVLIISSYTDSWNALRPEGELIIGLHRAGVEVTVMTQGDADYARRFREEGLEVVDFHPAKKFSKIESRFIRQVLQQGAFDIVHLFNNKAIVTGLRAAKKLPVKIVTYRGYAGNIHWYNPLDYFGHLHKRVDLITCVSPAVKKSLDKQWLFKKPKTVIVPKGHAAEWYREVPVADLQEFNLSKDAFVFSVVANARKMKGISYLVNAAHYLPLDLPIYFLLIGRGLDNASTLQLLKKSHYQERFIFTGFREDVLSLIQSCRAGILPSVKGEGLSKVLLESMFLGKACIMTDIPANEGLAVNGKTGLVIPPKDSHALAGAILQLAQNREFCEKMGKEAFRHVSQHYNLHSSVAKMVKIYQSLV